MFTGLCSRERLTEFVVLNVEDTDMDVNASRAAIRQKFRMVQVELARVEDFGKNDRSFFVKTHLGEILNFNDHVLGYDLEKINLTEIEDFTNNY